MRHLSRDLFPRASVLGIDSPPFFVERAAHLAKGIANVEFREGDAKQLHLGAPGTPGNFVK
jgi:trans-aconitate methyltransferase